VSTRPPAISLNIGDTSANDAQPAGEQGADYAVPCHAEMQTRRGIWNLEIVDTKSLIDAKVLEGALIWAPLRIVGGTGSTANPVVLY
jgi:kynurenine formamidase